MKLECVEHGELENVDVLGYSVGHWPGRLMGTDLEGTRFTIDVSSDTVTEDDISSNAEDYLAKFAGWREQIVDGINGDADAGDAIDMGLICPECGRHRETVRIVNR